MRYWTRIGLVSSILCLSFILLLIFLNDSRNDYSNDEAVRILQSAESRTLATQAAPLGVIIVITVISLVLVVSGFIIIAMILDPSTSLVEEVKEDTPMSVYSFHV